MKQIIIIALTTLKQRRISLIIYLLVGLGMLEMYIAIYPAIQEQAQVLTQAYQNLPQEFAAAFNVNQLAFSSLEGFLSVEHFSFVWPLLVILMSVSFGAILAGEIEKGTIEHMLSRPLSRLSYFFSKFLAASLYLLIFTALSTLMIAPLAQLHHIDFSFFNSVAIGTVGFLFGLAVLSLSFLTASFLKEKSRVFFISGGVLFIMYILNLLARLKDNLDFLKYFSFFHYFEGDIITKGTIPATSIIVFLSFLVAGLAIGAWRYNTKDIPV